LTEIQINLVLPFSVITQASFLFSFLQINSSTQADTTFGIVFTCPRVQKKRGRTFALPLFTKETGKPETYFAAGAAGAASAAGAAGAASAAGAAGASRGASTGASAFFAQPTKETELKRKRKMKSFFIAIIIFVV
jgi:hypothetical protein